MSMSTGHQYYKLLYSHRSSNNVHLYLCLALDAKSVKNMLLLNMFAFFGNFTQGHNILIRSCGPVGH